MYSPDIYIMPYCIIDIDVFNSLMTKNIKLLHRTILENAHELYMFLRDENDKFNDDGCKMWTILVQGICQEDKIHTDYFVSPSSSLKLTPKKTSFFLPIQWYLLTFRNLRNGCSMSIHFVYSRYHSISRLWLLLLLCSKNSN